MQRSNNFLVMAREEFRPWLQQQKITRTITRLQVHHTWRPAYEHFKDGREMDRLEAMRNSHMQTNGWREIGQNITTFPNGKIGISLGRTLNDTPAGIAEANTGALCIEHLGNFDRGGDALSPEQRETIIHVYATLAERLGLPIDPAHIVYHAWYTPDGRWLGDYKPGQSSKTCPGTNFFGGNTAGAARRNFLPLVQAEYNRLTGAEKEADELSLAEKLELAELRSEVKKLREVVSGLINSKDVLKDHGLEQAESLQTVSERVQKLEDLASMSTVPKWAVPAVNDAVAAGLIDTQGGGSYDFYRILTVLQRGGMLITRMEDK
ncbi:N-acetylmuramoyl-L-alanine amidase [Paenibacillus sp. CN-4]|uniref:peptidoglycan recognition protein family protein n=1 Tax=Paenibacillus nanchangensis TaxID=3348343 RepID=UPI00397D15C3